MASASSTSAGSTSSGTTPFGLGLTYMHARQYSPAFGRFLQPDPTRAERNPYAYTQDNPTSFIDPSGELLWFVIAAVAIRIAPIVVRAVAATATCAR